MKVVLFCGGLGTRLREYSDTIPKPMVNIGYRPIIWHVMKYYAHYGHKDFILCLGYRGDVIKDYFLKYDECLSNDFMLIRGGREVKLYNSDISEWNISFVDTGLHSNVGQRLKAIEPYLDGEETFFANYSDGVADFDLNDEIAFFRDQNKVGCFLAVQPPQTFHIVDVADDHRVKEHPAGRQDQHVDQRRFLHLQEVDFRSYQAGRRVGQRAVPAPDRRESTGGLSTQGILGLYGHLPGQADV